MKFGTWFSRRPKSATSSGRKLPRQRAEGHVTVPAGTATLPNLDGLSGEARRRVLIAHAMEVRQSKLHLIDRLDEKSQRQLRLIARTMAEKLARR